MPGNRWLHRWSPQEDAVALDAALTIAEAAERLGRTPAAVKGRRQMLRGTATKYAQGARPYVAPGRAERLVAKTCYGCGRLLPAEAYHRRRERMGSWSVKCRSCHDQEARAGWDQRQEASRARAARRGQPWTVQETRLALEDRPVEEIAGDLGRTYAAVVRRRDRVRGRLHTPREAAPLLGITPHDIYNYVQDGRVEPAEYRPGAARGGRVPYFRLADLVEAAAATRGDPAAWRPLVEDALSGMSWARLGRLHDLSPSTARWRVLAVASDEQLAQIRDAKREQSS
ncbi:MAG TPA: hypothetical protein VFJ09_02595 [Nocardioidaceae bacterium]|nr:hypothetical protein [Nocardioidaceae bacterium]